MLGTPMDQKTLAKAFDAPHRIKELENECERLRRDVDEMRTRLDSETATRMYYHHQATTDLQFSGWNYATDAERDFWRDLARLYVSETL